MVGNDIDTGIFKEHKYKFDKKLAKSIFDQFKNPVDVVDLGCGDGKYSKYGQNLGGNIQGYEGNKNVVDDNLVKYMDLSKEQQMEKKDLVICLEVGEHIPKKHEKVFVNNLNDFTKNTLLLSWGIIGQKGKGHVNCKDNNEVISIFENMGFIYDEETSMFLRKNATLKGFKNTVMVFNRE